MTSYGREFCQQLIEDLTPYDPIIVSGFAYGVDICAHKAAGTAKHEWQDVLGSVDDNNNIMSIIARPTSALPATLYSDLPAGCKTCNVPWKSCKSCMSDWCANHHYALAPWMLAQHLSCQQLAAVQAIFSVACAHLVGFFAFHRTSQLLAFFASGGSRPRARFCLLFLFLVHLFALTFHEKLE